MHHRLRRHAHALALALCAVPGSTALNGPPLGGPIGVGAEKPLPVLVERQVKGMLASTAKMQHKVNMAQQQAVADLFEFEHERAARFERSDGHSYWDDPRIHNFGNLGWRGLLHALVVPFATAAIDHFAYSGVDARRVIHAAQIPAGAEVVDLCCGVGFSAAPNARVTAVDTSRQMLNVARLRRPDVERFEVGNAEEWGETKSCDLVTLMYGMHEMPRPAQAL